jgi:hypothetical protein
MLRLLFLLLLLANGVYWAWAEGSLAGVGLAPVVQAEPQRLAQQLRPESVRVVSPEEARRLEAAAAAPPPKPPECLMAGLFDDRQVQVLRQTLAKALPENSWQLEPAVEPARWIVYMGRYANAEAVAKKKAELKLLNVPFDPQLSPALEPGLSLGGFDSQAAANAELGALSRRGVRTARVLLERAEARGQMLKLPAVDDALRARVNALKTELAGKSLRPCPANRSTPF